MTKVEQPIEIYKNLSLEDLPNEEWMPIKNFEEFYSVSNLGRVKSMGRKYLHTGNRMIVRKPRILRGIKNSDGYLFVILTDSILKKQFGVSRLVAIHFIPNHENKREVNHKKGIKIDNRASELEWATAKENVQHAFYTGLAKGKKGEDNVNSKLKDKDVVEIRKLTELNVPLREIALKYSVSKPLIRYIRDKKIWKHV